MCYEAGRERAEVHIVIFVGKSKGSRPLGNLGINGSVLLKLMFKRQNERAWTSFVSPRIGTTGLLL
jgi:hypothetical protein